MKVKKLVIDTSALIQNVPIQDFAEEIYTTKEVITEVKDKATRQRLRTVPYQFNFREPNSECYSIVKQASQIIGDYNNLSVVDLRVLALAVQMAREAGMEIKPLDKVEESKVQAGGDKNEQESLPGWGEWNEDDSSSDEEAENEESGLDLESLLDPETLDQHLADKSYISGFDLSWSDYVIFQHLGSCPDSTLINASRWYKHAATFTAEFKEMEAQNNEIDVAESETEDSDDDGWITPANINKFKHKGESGNVCEDDENTEYLAGCATGDFSMQNVLLKLGIPVISKEGMRVKQVRSWALRCATCRFICHDMSKIFCPSCGHRNLKRVPFTVDAETGEKKYFLSTKKQLKCLNLRGTKFSAPLPKGGKHCTDLILSEGMRIRYDRLSKKAMRKQNMLAGELDDPDNPFMMHDVSSRGFHKGNFRSKRYAVPGTEMTAQQLRMGAHLGNNKKHGKGRNRR